MAAGYITMSRAYHVLKIEGYSSTLSTQYSKPYYSCPFRGGGHTWHIRYYPKGVRCYPKVVLRTNTGYMSFYLVLDGIIDDVVMAQATFSLLDQNLKPVPSYSYTTGVVNFSGVECRSRGYGYADFMKREHLEKSEYLKYDCFAVRVDVHVLREAQPIVVPPSDMHQHLSDLRTSKIGADIEFLVSGVTFTAHSLVLGARSPVLREQLFNAKKEGATANIIEIDDMEAQVFDALLTFIYTDSLPVMSHEDEYTIVQGLLVASDRYNLQRLKLLCQYMMCNHINTGSVATILALAEMHRCHGLREACYELLGSLVSPDAVVDSEVFHCLTLSCPNITMEQISKV
ncbi:hypothetical protein EJB05_53741, partial [Eragrostis curvula]